MPAASAWRREHYENFPGCLLPAPGAGCGRTSPPSTRSPGPRTTSRMNRAARTPSGCGCSTTGERAWSRARSKNRPARHRRCQRQMFRALAHTIRECGLPVSLFARSAQRVQAGRACRSAMRPGTSCWTTAGVRPTRSDAWCWGSPGLRVAAARRAIGRGVHGPAVDQLLAGSANATGRSAGSTCRSRIACGPGAPSEDLAARRMTPEWREVMAEMVRPDPARCSTKGAPVCDGVEGRLRWELRLTWLGGSRILDRLERCRLRRLPPPRPKLGAQDAAALVWQAIRWNSGR